MDAPRARAVLALPAGSRWPAFGALAGAGGAVVYALSAYRAGPLVLPLAVAALALGATAVLRPAWGVGAALLAAPLELYALPLPSGALSPSETLLALVAAGWVWRALTAPRSIVLPSARDVPVGVLLAVVLAGLPGAADGAPVVRVFVLWTLFFLVFLQVQSLTTAELRGVLLAFAVGAGVLGAIGAAAYLRSGSATLFSGGLDVGLRATGTFTDANYYASLLGLAVLPALALLLGDWRRHGWVAPAVLAASAGIAFSLSRGGILGLVVGLLVLALWGRARWAILLVVVALATLTALDANPITGTTQYATVKERLGTLTGPALGQTNRRPQIWATAIDLVAEHPLTGVGINQFEHAAALRGLTERGRPIENVHNVPLSLAAETGLLGLVAFLALFGQLLARTVRAVAGAPDRGAYALGLGVLAALVAFAVQGLTVTQLRVNLITGALFVLGGIATALADRVPRPPANRHRASTMAP